MIRRILVFAIVSMHVTACNLELPWSSDDEAEAPAEAPPPAPPPPPKKKKKKKPPPKSALQAIDPAKLPPHVACEQLARSRLAVYNGPSATPGDAGALFDKNGASLDRLDVNGVRMAPRFVKRRGRPAPSQPGSPLLACYAELVRQPEVRPEMHFNIRVGAGSEDGVVTEPPAPPLARPRFEACLLDAARRVAGVDAELRPATVSGRFLPPDKRTLKIPPTPKDDAPFELVAKTSVPEVRRGATFIVRVAVRNRGKKPLSYVRATCERATLLDASVTGLSYGSKITACSSTWAKKVTIAPGRETVDTIRLKADRNAEIGDRRFQVFRRIGTDTWPPRPAPIVCSNPLTVRIRP